VQIDRGLEKIIGRLQRDNEALQRERDLALHRLDEETRRCGRLASVNQALTAKIGKLEGEMEQLQQQRLNDWKRRKSVEEKLIKLTAKQSQTVHRHNGAAARDITGDLRVSGSSLKVDSKDREGPNVSETVRGNRYVTEVESYPAVTTETVTSLRLPPCEKRGLNSNDNINNSNNSNNNNNNNNMLAATFPPRPRPARKSIVGLTGTGQDVMDLGQVTRVSPTAAKTTLHLPDIPHRTSSY